MSELTQGFDRRSEKSESSTSSTSRPNDVIAAWENDRIRPPVLSGPGKADDWMKWIHPIITGSVVKRQVLGFLALSSATSIGHSHSSNSAEDAAATSGAIAKASQHLNQILREGTVDDELGISFYLKKVEAIPQSRLPRNLHEHFNPSPYQYSLITAAAHHSDTIYASNRSPSSLFYESDRDAKACSIQLEDIDNRKVLVVAVRGSVTLEDWMLNTNGDPQLSEQLLDGTTRWHRGFLCVARSMELKIATGITEMRGSQDDIDSVLFTGHSAGGAISQIFYAASLSPETTLSQAVQGLEKIHCITFGAPPVATVAINTLSNAGSFISVINEGDPIPLAQEAYIKTLISVYALSKKDFAERHGPLGVPKPVFRISGDCVVLMDEDPDEPQTRVVKAVQVDANLVKTRLFGNPWLHLRDEYLSLLNAWRPGDM